MVHFGSSYDLDGDSVMRNGNLRNLSELERIYGSWPEN